MGCLKNLEDMRATGKLFTVSEILATACPEHFGPKAQKLEHGYWGYFGKSEIEDSVLEILGNGQNARPHVRYIGVHSYAENKPIFITVESHCNQCEAAIIFWRPFAPWHQSAIGECNSYQSHLSKFTDWRCKILKAESKEFYPEVMVKKDVIC